MHLPSLCLSAAVLVLGACASPSPGPSGDIGAEIAVSEAVAGAKYVAYWFDFELGTVRPSETFSTEEIDRLRGVAARLAAEADAVEEDLERATRDRVGGHDSDFHATAPRRARLLRDKTIEAQAQWSAFTAARDQRDQSTFRGSAGVGR